MANVKRKRTVKRVSGKRASLEPASLEPVALEVVLWNLEDMRRTIAVIHDLLILNRITRASAAKKAFTIAAPTPNVFRPSFTLGSC